MLLHSLLKQFDPAPDSQLDLSAIPNLEILGIRDDSRRVRRGDLFIARPGTTTDGLRFVEAAKARGAVAVVTQAPAPNLPLPQIVLPNPAAPALLAHTYHNHPSQKLKVIAVTGTNGKTTTTYLIRHILARHKIRCGLIGTVEIDDGRSVTEASLTTPGPVDLASLLASMRDHACKAAALEISSHALDQNRAAGIHFAAAGFTNLTGDHLDYHLTTDRYAAAKARLFQMLPDVAVAAVNSDDPHAAVMLQNCRAKPIRFALNDPAADYRATDIAVTSQGTNFVLIAPDGRAIVRTPLIGRHNIQNALCAAALIGETFALTAHQLAAALADAPGAPGRLQPILCGQKFAVLVDYAHTDDALKNVLTSLRPLTRNKLRVLFGCGGDRDRTKRPRMAAVAESLADYIYVTSDNPRTEDPAAILDQIAQGFSPQRPKCALINPDRRQAIQQIIQDAQPGDVVLIAGKGHETYQQIGTQKHPFDDTQEARIALTNCVTAPSQS